MATQPIMDFKKGDNQTHYFQMPEDSWTPGGLLWFAAKPAIDNDGADSAAVINKSFDDTKIVGALDEVNDMYEAGWVTYQLNFVPADIVNVSFNNGEDEIHYLGEFSFVSGVGEQESWPSDNNYIDTIIYADVKRAG